MRDNEILRELVGMQTMYENYIDKLFIRVAKPDHPITAGVDSAFTLTPGQTFHKFPVSDDIELIITGNSTKDEDLYLGFARKPEKGRVFYLVLEHETHNSYVNENIHKILQNAVHWVVADTEENAVSVSGGHNRLNVFPHSINNAIFFRTWDSKSAIYTINGRLFDTQTN